MEKNSYFLSRHFFHFTRDYFRVWLWLLNSSEVPFRRRKTPYSLTNIGKNFFSFLLICTMCLFFKFVLTQNYYNGSALCLVMSFVSWYSHCYSCGIGNILFKGDGHRVSASSQCTKAEPKHQVASFGATVCEVGTGQRSHNTLPSNREQGSMTFQPTFFFL